MLLLRILFKDDVQKEILLYENLRRRKKTADDIFLKLAELRDDMNTYTHSYGSLQRRMKSIDQFVDVNFEKAFSIIQKIARKRIALLDTAGESQENIRHSGSSTTGRGSGNSGVHRGGINNNPVSSGSQKKPRSVSAKGSRQRNQLHQDRGSVLLNHGDGFGKEGGLLSSRGQATRDQRPLSAQRLGGLRGNRTASDDQRRPNSGAIRSRPNSGGNGSVRPSSGAIGSRPNSGGNGSVTSARNLSANQRPSSAQKIASPHSRVHRPGSGERGGNTAAAVESSRPGSGGGKISSSPAQVSSRQQK